MSEAPGMLADLLARQARLREWIERLGEPQDDVPPHVAERVRADYESRLRELEGELRGHVDALHADAGRLREMLRLAREAHRDATDQLAEARLRHRLGEIDDADWSGRRVELERAVEESGAGEREALEELSRLEELLARLDGPVTDAPIETAAPALVPEESAESEDGMPVWEWAADPAADGGAAPEEAALPAIAADGESSEPDTRPTPGVKCPECGYTNDSTAWYCGVCGVDLT